MANDVFANGREISCKAASGKAIAAFPDVCFTPPQTPATPPGVPIPYPNTGMASDCTKGSKTVKISGKEVMLKNKSHFKKSMGDEAGCAPKKGVITSKNRGKVFFTAWSMDVKVEKKNVARHFDLTTHNHASMPGNSPPWAYTDTMSMQVDKEQDPCKETREKAEKKCGKHVKNNTYSTGRINKSGAKQDMCKDKDCQKEMECVLVPYDFGCCKGKTPHHVVPAHCFMPPGERGAGGPARYEGCEQYDAGQAPCVCVEGEGKELEHGEIHAVFDQMENSHKPKSGGAGTWSYNQAADAGAKSVKKAKKNCDETCTKAQLHKYHEKEAGISKGTKLRADSSGKSAPPPLNVVTPSGAFG